MKYKEFKLSDLFLIESTKSLDAGQLEFVENGVNFIGRTFDNNGIQGKIKRQLFEPNKANTITATVIGNYKYVKLQEEEYYCSQNINKLTPKIDGLSRQTLYYFITHIQKFVSKYNGQQGGYKLADINNHLILLPVKENDEIDFDFIDTLMNEIEDGCLNELEKYLNATGLNKCELNEEELLFITTKKQTKDFLIGEILEGKTGDVDLQQKDINGKGTYFINSGLTNSGIKGKTDKIARIFPSNTITIDFFGNAFYRDFEYKLATHNHVFSFSGEIIKNRQVGLYIASAMSYLKKIYSYQTMATIPSLKKNVISIPVDDNGEIDYLYMEKYISIIEKISIKDVVGWKNKDIV